MDSIDLFPLLEQLDGNLDDLEEALSHLLESPISNTAGKLPLLDKAKLYILITYALESTLFCLFSFSLLLDTKKEDHLITCIQ